MRPNTTTSGFWVNVTKSSECWLWIKSINRKGYGTTRYMSRAWLAHRLSYTFTYGPIPEGLNVLHKCDTPRCVRPDHLFVGTQADNVADMIGKGRKKVARGLQTGRYTKPERTARGEQFCIAKLTEQKVRDLRAAYANGASVIGLCREYGIAKTTFYNVIHRRTWAHVA